MENESQTVCEATGRNDGDPSSIRKGPDGKLMVVLKGLCPLHLLPLLSVPTDAVTGGEGEQNGPGGRGLFNSSLNFDGEMCLQPLQAAGTAVPSFTSELLDGREITPEAEFNIKWAASSLYGGGPYHTSM